MALLSEDQQMRVLALLREGRLDREHFALEVGVSPGTVSAIKANLTMGRYQKALPTHGESARTPAASETESGRSSAAEGGDVVCGVDGCPGGWVAVWLDLGSGRVRCEVRRTLVALAAASPSPSVIAIDIPIGLPQRGERACDLEARRLLGPRRASVFPAPIRPVLAASSWEEAGALRRRVEGKGLSLQAWAIVPKVREVDEALLADPALRRLVREVHPELSFACMNRERPMAFAKKQPDGRRERLAALRVHFGGAVDEALAVKPLGCAAGDLLDAFAAVWTAARIAHGQARSIPAEERHDEHGLRMEMVM
jgi:predicted RNase H-like nuclease